MAWDIENTKRRIYEAALAEFARFGRDGTTIDRIAARAGVNRERVYRYFGDKTALFSEVVRDELDRIAEAVPLTIAEPRDAGAFAGATFDYQQEHPDLARLVLWEGLAEEGVITDDAGRARLYQEKVAVMSAAQRAGRIDGTIAPGRLVFLLIALAGYWAAAPQVARMLSPDGRDAPAERDARRRAVVLAAVRLTTPPASGTSVPPEPNVVDVTGDQPDRGRTGRLAGATALVTGASSGIGAAIAEELAREGATVALLARRGDRLAALSAKINDGVADPMTGTGARRAYVYEVDVTDAEAVRAVVEQVARAHHGIDILVNNAGSGTWGPALTADLADWQATIDVNLGGVLNVTHAALGHLDEAARTRRRGVADIVTISSIAGRKVPGANSNVYAASKHAVGAFTEALRQELAPRHVRAGLVMPGVVVTELTTSGHPHAPDATTPSGYGFLDPQDVAEAVIFMVTRPRHAALNEVLIRPTEQII